MIFDNGIKNLISAAFSEEYDVFLKIPFPFLKDTVLDFVRSVVLLPGAFGGFAQIPFSDYMSPERIIVPENNALLTVADVRFMADENFRNMLSAGGYSRIFVPFAECADSGEYGYRGSYSWIGEYKAERADFCQTVAFISPLYNDLNVLSEIYSCKNVISVGRNTLCEPRIYKVSSVTAKFFTTASEAEKYPFEKICIFFNSRQEARQFGRFLHKRRTPYYFIDGSVCTNEKRKILDDITKNSGGILLATKSFLADSIYCDFSRCIICGVPYSFAHLQRCSSVANYEKTLIVYCEDDYVRNEKASLSYSEFIGDRNIYIKRQQSLFEIKNYLESR